MDNRNLDNYAGGDCHNVEINLMPLRIGYTEAYLGYNTDRLGCGSVQIRELWIVQGLLKDP